MNPYEPTLPNVIARVTAWCRGLLRRYRRPLLVIVAATATVAVGVSAAIAPPAPVLVAQR
ncbi:MAG: hypothetical protein ACOYLS_06125 [Polymorphobacter sp.]